MIIRDRRKGKHGLSSQLQISPPNRLANLHWGRGYHVLEGGFVEFCLDLEGWDAVSRGWSDEKQPHVHI